MKTVLRPGAVSAAVGLGLCLAMLPIGQAQAQTFVPCNDIPALKAAINQANTTGEAVVLATGCTYSLSTLDTDEEGLPEITGNVRISALNATIERSADATDDFRIFHVLGGGKLTLNMITVRGGQIGTDGGGIRNEGTLVLNRSSVRDNQAGYGGGGGIFSSGVLTANASTVKENQSQGQGGGILNAGGTLTLKASSVTYNNASSWGGGIYNYSGTMTMSGGSLSHNSGGGYGGGLENYPGSTATFNAVTVSHNTSTGVGGGIDNDGSSTLRLNATTVKENTAVSGGGISNLSGTSTLAFSRVKDNTATGGPGSGGGILESGGEVTLLATLVADNTPENCAPPGAIPGCTNTLASMKQMQVAKKSTLSKPPRR